MIGKHLACLEIRLFTLGKLWGEGGGRWLHKPRGRQAVLTTASCIKPIPNIMVHRVRPSDIPDQRDIFFFTAHHYIPAHHS